MADMERNPANDPGLDDAFHRAVAALDALLSAHRAQFEAPPPPLPFLHILPANLVEDDGQEVNCLLVLKIEADGETLLWQGTDRSGALAVASIYGLPVIDDTAEESN